MNSDLLEVEPKSRDELPKDTEVKKEVPRTTTNIMISFLLNDDET